MNRVVLGSALFALVLGAVGGFLGSGWWSGRLRTQLQEAQASVATFEQQVGELRVRNDEMNAQLRAERARAESTATDLRREKEMNARLHLLVSDGRK